MRIILILPILIFSSCYPDYVGCEFQSGGVIEQWQDNQRNPECESTYNFHDQTINEIRVVQHSGCLLDISYTGTQPVTKIAVGWNENGVMQEFTPDANGELTNLIIGAQRSCLRIMVNGTIAATFRGDNQ